MDAGLRAERFAAAGLDERALATLLGLQFAAWRRDRELHHPQRQERIVLLDGHGAGLVAVERIGGALQIVDLVLLGAVRRRGVGAAVLSLLFTEADEAGLALTGQVEAANEAALRFYARAGFRVSRRDTLTFNIERSPTAPPESALPADMRPAGKP